MKKISKKQINSYYKNGGKCVKIDVVKNFGKDVDYHHFKSIYFTIKQEHEIKLNIKEELKKDAVFCKTAKIKLKHFNKVKSLFNKVDLSNIKTAHSMGCLTEVTIHINGANRVIKVNDNRFQYAKSCKYKAKHGYVNLIIDSSIFSTLLNAEFKLIGGVHTFILNNSKNKIKECLVINSDQKKYDTNFFFVKYFLYKNFHSASIEGCLNWKQEEFKRVLKQRSSNQEYKLKLKKFVGYQHSINAGNCEIGTNNFINRHQLDKNYGYTIEFLLSLEDTPFTRKLLKI